MGYDDDDGRHLHQASRPDVWWRPRRREAVKTAHSLRSGATAAVHTKQLALSTCSIAGIRRRSGERFLACGGGLDDALAQRTSRPALQ